MEEHNEGVRERGETNLSFSTKPEKIFPQIFGPLMIH